MTNVTNEMVDRFLSWQLPDDVCVDPNCAKPGDGRPRHGTGLLTHAQAHTMLTHVVGAEGLRASASTPQSTRTENLVGELVSDICELTKADPDDPNTVCVNVDSLIVSITQTLTAAGVLA